MDKGTKYRVPIGDACVSMRVCFDSLCFSSTQQPLADEEEDAAAASSQLPTTHGAAAVVAVDAVTSSTSANNTTAAAAAAATTQVTQVPHIIGGTAGGGAPITAMGTLRELQELLRAKDERIAELEAVVCCRDAEIQELRSHLDKFLSVLPFSAAPPLTTDQASYPRPCPGHIRGASAPGARASRGRRQERQVSRINQDCHSGQRLYEKFRAHANPRDRRLYVSCYVSGWFDHYTRGRCWLYCLCYGGTDTPFCFSSPTFKNVRVEKRKELSRMRPPVAPTCCAHLSRFLGRI
ncbi:hypothetical protein ACS0PU_011909 [Formica fusca]